MGERLELESVVVLEEDVYLVDLVGLVVPSPSGVESGLHGALRPGHP